MFCENCGVENSDSSRFCKRCGEKFSPIQRCTDQPDHHNAAQLSLPLKKHKWRNGILLGIISIVAIFGIAITLLGKGWSITGLFLNRETDGHIPNTEQGIAPQTQEKSVGNTSDNANESIVYYYGTECPHCQRVQEFLDSNNVTDTVRYAQKEIWHDTQNNDELTSRAKSVCGLDPSQIGVPLVIADSQCFTGETDVMNFFKAKLNPLSSTTQNDFTCGISQVKDDDGNTYDTVKVGDQCWMASNMNIGKKIAGKKEQTDNGKIEKWCYDDDGDNCDLAGGLYTWDEAMRYSTAEGAQGICPDGWHIPSREDVRALKNSVHTVATGYKNLGWTVATEKVASINGKISLRFPLNGFCFKGECQGVYNSANFWVSSNKDGTHAYDGLITADETQIVEDSSLKMNGFSVRCLKD